MISVSILMPAYNAERFLRPALESILAQTLTDFELLAVEDGSSDETLEILRAYAAQDARIKIIEQPHSGQSMGYNRAMRQASADLLLVCDADDILLPECLAQQVAFMQNNPDVVGAGCLARFINARDELFWRDAYPILTREDYRRALQSGEVFFFRHTGFIMRRAAFKQIGGYRLVNQANDIDFFNRLADHGPILTNPSELVYYRVHPGQATTGYNRILDPRLTWAWISACNQARRRALPEPELQDFLQAYSRWAFSRRLLFTMNALAVGYFYEAKVDFICRSPAFLWKAALAALFSPMLVVRRLFARLAWK